MEKPSSPQQRLSELLKKKGIGPEASKSLKLEEAEEIEILLKESSISLTTKATLLTALLTLSPNEVEKQFINAIKENPTKFLPEDLIEFVTDNSTNPFLKIIRRIIALEDLDEKDSSTAMNYFLDESQPEHLKGAFLEAERLKRETFVENKAFFNSLWNAASRTTINIPVLIDIADSYDGCNRTRHLSVFVAATIASLGYPTYLHGLDQVAPKEAVTSHQILKAAGKNPLNSVQKTISDILNPEIAWGYVDQSISFPKLFALKKMRKEMVKRPFLATFEKLLQPVFSSKGNFLVTGYTHSHYREELINQLKEQGKCSQALVLKGVEGSTQISMARDTVAIHFDGQEIFESTVNPQDFNLAIFESKRDLTITPEVSLNEGIEALEGKDGFAKENIIYTAAVILSAFGLESKSDISNKLRDTIMNGNALKHWEKGAM